MDSPVPCLLVELQLIETMLIFRQKFKLQQLYHSVLQQHTAPPLDFVKELRDPHCRCNLRAIVSQELLFNLEPFKKVGRRHNKQASRHTSKCMLQKALFASALLQLARQPYSMLSSLALTQLPQQLVCTMYVCILLSMTTQTVWNVDLSQTCIDTKTFLI